MMHSTADVLLPTNCRHYCYEVDKEEARRRKTALEAQTRSCAATFETKSSPGRSTTTHIVLDLRSLIWGFGESCTIVHRITSQPANVS